MSTHLGMTTTLFDSLPRLVVWMWCGTCAGCLWTEVSTHLRVSTTLFDWLPRLVVWMWCGICASCLWIEVWMYAATLLDRLLNEAT